MEDDQTHQKPISEAGSQKPGPPVAGGEALSHEELDEVSGGIGSQSTSAGAGAGKINFNPFSITRKIDKTSHRVAGRNAPFCGKGPV